jgi:hypothetical protein
VPEIDQTAAAVGMRELLELLSRSKGAIAVASSVCCGSVSSAQYLAKCAPSPFLLERSLSPLICRMSPS